MGPIDVECPHCGGSGRLDAEPLRRTILANIAIEGECWIWIGSRTTEDYGQIMIRRQKWAAHRLAYIAFVGPIADDLVVRHDCDRPPCVNPSHLRLGSVTENNRDRLERGRYVQKAGAENPASKLTQEQVDAIRAEYEATGRSRSLAREYGISHSQLQRIVRGTAWPSSPNV